MKYLKNFNENNDQNNDQRLSKSDIDHILNVFNDLVDEWELYDLSEGEQKAYGYPNRKIEYYRFVELLHKEIKNKYVGYIMCTIPIYQKNGINTHKYFNSTINIEDYDFYIYINLDGPNDFYTTRNKFLEDLNKLFIDRLTSEFDIYLCKEYNNRNRFIVCIKPKQ